MSNPARHITPIRRAGTGAKIGRVVCIASMAFVVTPRQRCDRVGGRRRPTDRRRSAEAHGRPIAAVRRAAAGVRLERKDQRQAVVVRASGIAWPEQGGPAVHRACGGQRRRTAGGQSSRSSVGSMDVDAGHRARPPHRAAGSFDQVLRHRFQLRGPRRARREPVPITSFRVRSRSTARRAGKSSLRRRKRSPLSTRGRSCSSARTITRWRESRTT